MLTIVIWFLSVLGAIEVLYFVKESFEDYVARKVSEAINETVKTMNEN